MRMNIEQIYSCPFCGGPPELIRTVAPNEKYYVYVRCRLCRGQGRVYGSTKPPDIDNWDSFPVSDAILSWNLRSGQYKNRQIDNYADY